MSSRRAVAALALLAAAAPAAAFVRSTTQIDPSPDPTQGVCLAWATKQVTLVVNAGAGAFHGNACASGAAALVHQSFAPWSTPTCTDFKFTDGGDTTSTTVGNDGQNLIVVRQGSCGDIRIVPAADPCHQPGATVSCATAHNCWEHSGDSATIALTTSTFRTSDGTVIDADTEVFGWNGQDAGSPLTVSGGPGKDGWYMTCGTTGPVCASYGDSGCRYIDLGHTVTHEVGHILGLDHPCVYPQLPSSTCADANAIMAATVIPGNFSRALTQDDANGVCAIYPAGKAISSTNGCFGNGQAAGSNSSGGGGCGIGGGGALALVGLLPLALRRRRAA